MVIWTKPAKEDLNQIHDFISTDSKLYAGKVIEDVILRTQQIDKFPLSGRIVPEIQNENIREIFIYSYRLMYEFSGNDVYILTIVHGSRDFEELLK